MPKASRSGVNLALFLVTVVIVVIAMGLLIWRVRAERSAIASIGSIAAVNMHGELYRPIVPRIEFQPRGPDWLRSQLGEEWCHRWIDMPIAVDLRFSAATDADMVTLGRLTSLRKVDLTIMGMTDTGLKSLGNLTALEDLTLDNLESDTSLESLQALVNLQTLRLDCRTTSDRGLRTLTNLKHLELSAREITDSQMKILGDIQSLEWLQLGDAPLLTDAGIRELARLPALKVLSLGACQLTDTGMKSLAEITTLETLTLNASFVKDPGLLELLKLPHLHRLNLRGRLNFTDDCVSRFQKKSPGVGIIYLP